MIGSRGQHSVVPPMPRGPGHVNLHVSDWRKSLAFYRDRCGLGEVYRDEAVGAAFLTSGFNHHEVEVFQRPRAAFNHLGIEIASEADLVLLWGHLRRNGIDIERTIDSRGMARSVFTRDPEGNGLHLIANLSADWASFWRTATPLDAEAWDPSRSQEHCSEMRLAQPVAVERSERAEFRPVRFGGMTLSVADLSQSVSFYTDLVGFRVMHRGSDRAVLAGFDPGSDLTLVCDAMPRGLVSFSLALDRAGPSGAGPHRLRDPDGFTVVLSTKETLA